MASDRKKDHIELAFKAQTRIAQLDDRFNYEPLLSAHPSVETQAFSFLGKSMRVPIWISSMTGGTDTAMRINKNLATAAREYGLGMGLGSCRILLEENRYPEQFMLKDFIGNEVPFYANLGIPQIEAAVLKKSYGPINTMLKNLGVDGLIIHINPMQEWFQPEGEVLKERPIDMIQEFLKEVDFPVIVKEVGQGMGPQSIKELIQLPLQAIDFGAFGGTNFAKLELHRSDAVRQELMEPLSLIGNDAESMLQRINQIHLNQPDLIKTKELIISGGIKNFLDGYYFIKKSTMPAIYGQASMFLKYAQNDYQSLKKYIELQIKGLQVAEAYLQLKK